MDLLLLALFVMPFVAYIYVNKIMGETPGGSQKTSYEGLTPSGISIKGRHEEIKQLLEKESYFFRSLLPEQKVDFVERVIRFNSTTSFYNSPGLLLNARHVILISSTFVQLTFGLRRSMLDRFNHIQIFPAHYKNEKTRQFHKGEVDITGLISLSWEDYEIGNSDPHDGRNVGLHEMAHAFAIEIIESDMNYHHLVMKLKPIFLRARYEINNPYQRPDLLRGYGYSNMHEYFAVSTEVFFESPEHMASIHPALYIEMAKLFHQDVLTQYRQHESGLSNNQIPNSTQLPPV
jgi:Mlc titration factor MtfA (ptsG expression regulator)